jgi:hypothetical protein
MLDGQWSYDEWRDLHLEKWVAKRKWLCSVLPAAALRDQLLLEQPDWAFDEFMSQHLAAYLVMSAEFMDEFSQQQQTQQQ